MSWLNGILARFEKADLKEVENAGQQRRTETKFLVPYQDLEGFLNMVAPHYKVLSINNDLVFNYHTQYFDTPAFDMYLSHHNGKLNRFKIRERSYRQTQTSYLEVKFSNNSGRIFKYRIPQPAPGNLQGAAPGQFISSRTPYAAATLLPSLEVLYSRISLINKRGSERVTIDLDLELKAGAKGFKISKFAVVEVKQLHRTKSPVLNGLKDLKIKEQPFSKYCLGVNYLYPGLKKNNFKKKLTALNKLLNDPSFNLVAGAG